VNHKIQVLVTLASFILLAAAGLVLWSLASASGSARTGVAGNPPLGSVGVTSTSGPANALGGSPVTTATSSTGDPTAPLAPSPVAPVTVAPVTVAPVTVAPVTTKAPVVPVTVPAHAFTTFSVSYPSTCVQGTTVSPVLTWKISGASGAAVSVDNPGVVGSYGDYPAADTETMPSIGCLGPVGAAVPTHVYTVDALGVGVTAVTKTVVVAMTVVAAPAG
jgi:hypothetical protein